MGGEEVIMRERSVYGTPGAAHKCITCTCRIPQTREV